eukprot:CFRG1550T1
MENVSPKLVNSAAYTYAMETKSQVEDASVLQCIQKEPRSKQNFRHNGRWCWGGMKTWVFILLIIFVALAVIISIIVPVGFIVIGEDVAQSDTNEVVITITNQSVVYWGQNYIDSCTSSGKCTAGTTNSTCEVVRTPECKASAQLVPNVLILNQTLVISNVKFPALLKSTKTELYYTMENKGNNSVMPTIVSQTILIGDMYVPELDLRNANDGTVTLSDIEMILRVRNETFFTSLASVAIAPGQGGIWFYQTANAVVQGDIISTTMDYKVDMKTWIFSKDLLQCDGPLSTINAYTKGCPCTNDCISFST